MNEWMNLLRQGLSLKLDSLIQLGWLSSELPGSSCLCISRARTMSTCHSVAFPGVPEICTHFSTEPRPWLQPRYSSCDTQREMTWGLAGRVLLIRQSCVPWQLSTFPAFSRRTKHLTSRDPCTAPARFELPTLHGQPPQGSRATAYFPSARSGDSARIIHKINGA